MNFVFFFLFVGIQASIDLISPNEMQNIIDAWESQENLLKMEISHTCIDNAFVTFVMPTSCIRTTLSRAIESIMKLNDCNWRLILVYSDFAKQNESIQYFVPPPLAYLPAAFTSDPRIQYLWSRTGHVTQNYGGSMRNLAFQYVTTPWIAFLDDDDAVTVDYVDRLRYEVNSFPEASLILFRMACQYCFHNITPPVDLFDIEVNHAGISFAVKSEIVSPRGRLQFNDGPGEDHHFLVDAYSCEKYLVISGSITYLVKGFVVPLDRVVPSVQLPGKNNCREMNYNPPLAKRDYLGFTFPDEKSVFFRSNIIGLKQSLFRARLAGCVDDRIFHHFSVEFHFGFATKVMNPNDLLIQAQMEQIHNHSLPKGNDAGTVFGHKYISKMKQAVQVWASTPSHYRFLTEHLQLTNVYFVPQWSYLELPYGGDPDYAQEKTKNEIPSCDHQEPLVYSPDLQNNRKLEKCVAYPLGCELNMHNLSIPLCNRPKVLFFGAIENSFLGKRVEMCNYLKRKLQNDFDCFEGIFGIALESMVETASIVVLERYYKLSCLETHRVDPLLLKGKIVVTSPSFDRDLNRMYEGSGVVFVRDVPDMGRTIGELLTDEQKMKYLSELGKRFIKLKARDPGPICRALSSLKNVPVIKKERRRKHSNH